jgi:hypothetical protein
MTGELGPGVRRPALVECTLRCSDAVPALQLLGSALVRMNAPTDTGLSCGGS